MFIDNHGGECCGVSHIHGFPQYNETHEQTLKKMMETRLDSWVGLESERADGSIYHRLPSHLFEIVLTDGQLADGWAAGVKRVGFRHVARWYNSNSDNYCNMFVWNRKATKKRNW